MIHVSLPDVNVFPSTRNSWRCHCCRRTKLASNVNPRTGFLARVR